MFNKLFKSGYTYMALVSLGIAALVFVGLSAPNSNSAEQKVPSAPSSVSSSESAPSLIPNSSAAATESSLPISSESIQPQMPSSSANSAASSEQNDEPDDNTISGKFKSARKSNSDTVGWLHIKGTKCDYAVMQSDDNEYYLERNEKKKKSSRGALFADFRCSFDGELSKNTVIYGHSMKDGSMFTQLFVYKKLSTLQNRPIIDFCTDDKTESRWKIFACMITDTNFDYINPNPSDAEFARMIEEMRNRSLFTTNVEVGANDKLLTLSTCSYEYKNDNCRFVVVARRLRDGESEEITASKNQNVKSPQF